MADHSKIQIQLTGTFYHDNYDQRSTEISGVITKAMICDLLLSVPRTFKQSDKVKAIFVGLKTALMTI